MLYVCGVRKSGKSQWCMFQVFVDKVNHNGIAFQQDCKNEFSVMRSHLFDQLESTRTALRKYLRNDNSY